MTLTNTIDSYKTLEASGVKLHVEYDLNRPPKHPGEGWTRFICVSDTHSKVFTVPPGDVLLHSGDLSAGGYLKALKKTMDWLVTLDHPQKVCVSNTTVPDVLLTRLEVESSLATTTYVLIDKTVVYPSSEETIALLRRGMA
jgi:hypothetical protein